MKRLAIPEAGLSAPADEVAVRLLGQYLCRQYKDGRIERYIITEVEAYLGENDKACHSYKGRTKRTEVMYGPPGYWYVYLIYGMYYMLNLVVSPEGEPQAILIRGVQGIEGPGKITKKLQIGKLFNGLQADRKSRLWIEESGFRPAKIIRLPRIGVGYAGEWKDKLLRFRLVK